MAAFRIVNIIDSPLEPAKKYRASRASHAWPYPDVALCGPRAIEELYAHGVAEIRELKSSNPVTTGPIDIGKHLRPNWRGWRLVLFVDAVDDSASPAPWRAIKLR